MRKVIAAMNITVDGFCDHTAGIADEETHQHYADLLSSGHSVLYGRITYELMQYWQNLAAHPSGEKSMDDFANVMDKIPKIVFSKTLKSTDSALDWASATLATRNLEEEVLALKQSGNDENKDILVGSPSLIIQLLNLNLIDEFQLCIHPVAIGHGLPLFEKIKDRTVFKLVKTKTFACGAVVMYYRPTSKHTKDS